MSYNLLLVDKILSNSSKEKRTKKTYKRKINWSEYNESLVKRGEMLFDDWFFTAELASSRAKANEQRKGRRKL